MYKYIYFYFISLEYHGNISCLIRLVGPAVNKINKNFQNAIRLTERLPITLRFLANGDSHCRTTYLLTLSEQSVRLTSQLFETQMNTDARLHLVREICNKTDLCRLATGTGQSRKYRELLTRQN